MIDETSIYLNGPLSWMLSSALWANSQHCSWLHEHCFVLMALANNLDSSLKQRLLYADTGLIIAIKNQKDDFF